MNEVKKGDLSTEEKIRIAAKKVFLQKGYSGTRTRDIAEEAGINLALLNYYFRSKQKLFEEVMLEKIQKLLGSLIPIMNDGSTTLEEKIEKITGHYIDIISDNPDLPIFVISELHKGNFEAFPAFPFISQVINSSLLKQFAEKRSDLNPVQLMVTLMGLTIFPFLAKPIVLVTGLADEQLFNELMQERKSLVVTWMKSILNEKTPLL